jgi:hypothetical protein
MPALISSIDHLADIPLYKTEKPYFVMPSATDQIEEDFATSNLEFERHDNIHFSDVRGCEDEFNLETSGFQIIPHVAKNLVLDSVDQLEAYKTEIEVWLKELFGAEHIVCYETKVRNFT